MIGAFLSMGWPARWVNISAIETYGHEVCEVWSNVWNKWVFMDATRDYYAYCPDTGVPLDLLEMNERLTEVMPSAATREEPAQHWIGPEDDELLLSARIGYRNGDHERKSCPDVAGIWVAFFQERQQYRCGQITSSATRAWKAARITYS
eukprot:COSAG04_NODE_1129_length_8137_cov_2.288007_2_plen_149_part_00